MHDIRVSVIMPVCNSMPYLKEALGSVLAQTLENIELICIDDHSADDSLEVLELYSKRDDRIKVIKNEINRGAGMSRNIGIENAKGEYLAFVDSDDRADPDMMKKMYEKACFHGADIAVCDYAEVDLNGNLKFERRLPDWFVDRCITGDVLNDHSAEYLPCICGGLVWRCLYKRDFVKREGLLFQDVKNSDDTFFSAAAVISANRIVYMGNREKALLFYRTGNAMSQVNSRVRDVFSCYEAGKRLFEYIDSKNLPAFRKASFSYWIYTMWTWIDRMTPDQCSEFAEMMINNGLQDLNIEEWVRSGDISPDDRNRLNSIFKNGSDFSRLPDMIAGMVFDVPKLFRVLWERSKHPLLWGFGKTGRIIYDLCKDNSIRLEGIVDISGELTGKQVDEYVIQYPDKDHIMNADLILVSNYKLVKDIRRSLENIDCIIPVFDVMSFCRFDISFEECLA